MSEGENARFMHWRNLQTMFESASINQQIFPGSSLKIGEGFARISFPVISSFHHALGAMHGCIYFKMLDDACYFAAASTEFDFFMLTKSFSLQFLRPFSEGMVVAEGRLTGENGGVLEAEGTLWADSGKVLAIGNGTFARSKTRLSSVSSY